MNNKLLIAIITVVGVFAQAYNKPRNLEQAMKMMQLRLKQISLSVNDVKRYSKLAQLADEFTLFTIDAKAFIPNAVNRLPPAEREVKKDLYESMMDDASVLGEKLAESLRAQDQLKTNDLVSRLTKAKTAGHKEFKTGGHLLGTLQLPSNLKDTMKQIGSNLKTISLQLNDPSLNEGSIKMANEISDLLLHSKSFMPDLIAQAPAAEQAEMKARYDKSIDDTIILATTLAEALRNANTKLAQDTIDQMIQAKKDGHSEFK